ncbi:MAG: glycosyltransferase family A protein [Nitrososphaeraceae archaeon]
MRNEEKYIEECLDGLLRQTYQNFEIIVVDDGSSDRTAQLLQRYGMKDARIKIVTIDVDARLDGKDLGVLSRLYPFNR